MNYEKKCQDENVSSKDFARFFINKVPNDKVLTEVYKFFAVNCVDFCKINPKELDSLIEKFNENGSDKVHILTEIINRLRWAEGYSVMEKKNL